MSDDDRYFEEELNYLVEAGREYARLHPDRAKFLNLADARSRDPHVQRLLEGFAFLTGSIRRRLDDDFPEITHALLNLVWPHYLRPIPPIALLEFTPLAGMIREPQTIPKGFLVDSKFTSHDLACRFATAFPVTILPLSLSDALVTTDDGGQPVLRLRLAFEGGADPTRFPLDRLRLFIADEPAKAFSIYHVLRTSVDAITVRTGRDRARVIPGTAITPVGFADDEDVLPYPKVSFPGYRLLSEYFAFREKFRFVDVRGIGVVELEPRSSTFDLDIAFTKRPPDGFRPSVESFKLFVTPIVNLFPRDGEPITVTHVKQKYRVLGDYTHPDAFDVISVDGVEGVRQSDGVRRTHHDFYSFGHDQSDLLAEQECLSYQITNKVNAAGRWATHLALISATDNQLPAPEVLSLNLTCSNGRLCREVGLEDIRTAAGERPGFVTFRNITRPTEPVYPKLGEGAAWRFISHMALTFMSISDPGALKAILALYDVGDAAANRRRIDSIIEVSARPVESLVRGTPIRGTEVTVTLDERGFDDAGDLLLFSEILNEFMALHTAVNSFTTLVVRRSPSGKEHRCPQAYGKQRPI